MSRRETASINSSACSKNGDGIGAAVVTQRNFAPAGRDEIGLIVAGRQTLHEPQLGRGLIELLRHHLLYETHKIVRAWQCRTGFRRIGESLYDLEAFRREVVDHRQTVLRTHHENTLDHHSPPEQPR